MNNIFKTQDLNLEKPSYDHTSLLKAFTQIKDIEDYRDFVYAWRILYKNLSNHIRLVRSHRKGGTYAAEVRQFEREALRKYARRMMSVRMERKSEYKKSIQDDQQAA